MALKENQVAVIEKKPYEEEGIYKLAKSNFTDDTTCVFWHTYWIYFNKNKLKAPITWNEYRDNKDYMHATESQIQQLKQLRQQQQLPKSSSNEKRKERFVIVKDTGKTSNTLAESDYTGLIKLKTWHALWCAYDKEKIKLPVASWKEYCESTKYLKATESQIEQYKKLKQKKNPLGKQQKQLEQQQTPQQLQQQPQPQKPLHQLQHQQLQLQQQLHQLQQQRQPTPQTLQQDRLIQQQKIDSLIRQQIQQRSLQPRLLYQQPNQPTLLPFQPQIQYQQQKFALQPPTNPTQQTSQNSNSTYQNKRSQEEMRKTDTNNAEENVEQTPKPKRQKNNPTKEYEQTFEWPEYEFIEEAECNGLTKEPDYCLPQEPFSEIDNDASGWYQWNPISVQSNDGDNKAPNNGLSSSVPNTSSTLFYSPQNSGRSTQQSDTKKKDFNP